MGINVCGLRKKSKPKDLGIIDVPRLVNVTKTTDAPRLVTLTRNPKNGRCPLPKGIVSQARVGPSDSTPESMCAASKTPPRRTSLTGVSELLAPIRTHEHPSKRSSSQESIEPQTTHSPSEPPANATPETYYLNFLVGTQDPTSHYKTQRLFRIQPYLIKNAPLLSKHLRTTLPPLLSDPNPIIPLPHIDAQAFDLYIKHQPLGPHTRLRSSPTQKSTWRECWPLLNAHMFGTTIQDADFADLILDVLVEKLHPDQCADADTIAHVFAACGVSLGLKRFLTEQYVEASRGRVMVELEGLPHGFAIAMVEAAMGKLAGGGDEGGGCRFHGHGGGECYREKLAAGKTKRFWG